MIRQWFRQAGGYLWKTTAHTEQRIGENRVSTKLWGVLK